MDFHSMPRRQLQTLCKQNRIPANITNVAMADALQALHAAGSLENAEEVIKDLTPLVPSSRKASLRRQVPASAADLEASIEPREQPASPLPRARSVTVKASEIRRLAVEGEENEKEEVEKEAVREATPRTVVKCSSMKPPPRSSRRATKKNDVEAKEEDLVDAMKTPAPLTGRKTAARKLAKTPVAVEQEAAETVVSARVTTRRTTRQSTRATAEDSAKSIVRRSSRIRSKTEESALKTGSSFQEVEPEQGTEIKNALVEEDNNGDKDCDLAVVDSDVPQNSLEEIVLAPEAKEFVTLPVVSEEKQLDKVEVDDHCEKICTLVVVGDNIPTMHDLEEDRITPNTEELGAAKGEFMDMPTEEADVKELGTVAQQHLVSLQLHLFPNNDKEKPMDMITEKVDELDEIAPEDEEFTDVEELGSMVQHHEGGDTKDDCDRNEDEGIHGDQHRIVESGESDDNEDEVIQENEVSIGEVLPETQCDFEGSPVQGLITSLENLEITKDGPKENEEDFAPQDDETKHAADEQTKETEEDFHLEDLAPEDDETKQEIPGVAVDSIIQNPASDITDCDNEVEIMTSDLEAKTTGEVIAVPKCQLSGADKETDDYSTKETEEDFHLEYLALEDYEAKQEIPGVSVDSIIQYHASDIPDCDYEVETMSSDLEAKTTDEVIAVTKCQLSGADKETDDYSTKETEEDFHLEYLALEDYEAKQEIPGVSVDSIIQYHASDIPDCDNEVETMASDLEGKATGEVIAVTKCQLSGADKENDDDSAELFKDVVVNEDKKQNAQENLESMSLRKLKKMYKEKISNADKVKTKRQALNDVNQNIVL